MPSLSQGTASYFCTCQGSDTVQMTKIFIKHVYLTILTMRMATKQASVVFQSPYDDALPTNTP